jgi:hypothetical protein
MLESSREQIDVSWAKRIWGQDTIVLGRQVFHQSIQDNHLHVHFPSTLGQDSQPVTRRARYTREDRKGPFTHLVRLVRGADRGGRQESQSNCYYFRIEHHRGLNTGRPFWYFQTLLHTLVSRRWFNRGSSKVNEGEGEQPRAEMPRDALLCFA